MIFMWIALTAAMIALLFTKQTKFYELMFLGGWGILTGALCMGAHAFTQLNLGRLWNAVF